jgi:hypothetical protein
MGEKRFKTSLIRSSTFLGTDGIFGFDLDSLTAGQTTRQLRSVLCAEATP